MDAFINLIKFNPLHPNTSVNAIMKYISSFATQIHTLHIRQPDISSSPIPAPLTFFGFFLCAMFPFHTTRVPAKENWERLTTPNYHNFFSSKPFPENECTCMHIHVSCFIWNYYRLKCQIYSQTFFLTLYQYTDIISKFEFCKDMKHM